MSQQTHTQKYFMRCFSQKCEKLIIKSLKWWICEASSKCPWAGQFKPAKSHKVHDQNVSNYSGLLFYNYFKTQTNIFYPDNYYCVCVSVPLDQEQFIEKMHISDSTHCLHRWWLEMKHNQPPACLFSQDSPAKRKQLKQYQRL